MNLFWLALAWLAFAALHSALAAFVAKEFVARRWPEAAPWYRLGFNVIAALALLPILWATYAIDAPPLWQWAGPWRWLSYGLAGAAGAGFVAVSRSYDMPAFLGLRQVREHDRSARDRDGFVLSPFHRYVRHPWYFCGLVLVWTGDKNAPLLVTAIAITLYFLIGSRLEEKKLLAMHGAAYRAYMQRVPALFPLPWKTLSRSEARKISAAQ